MPTKRSCNRSLTDVFRHRGVSRSSQASSILAYDTRHRRFSFVDRAKEAIPSIAETGADELIRVEFAIKPRDVERYVRVLLKHTLHTLGRGDDPDKRDLAGAARFEFTGSCRGGTRRREHRIEQDEEVAGEVVWEAVVIANWVVRRFVPVDPDVVNGGLGKKDARPVGHPESRAEDGDESNLCGNFAPHGRFERRPIGDSADREVTGRFVEQQHCQFMDEVAKVEGVGPFVR